MGSDSQTHHASIRVTLEPVIALEAEVGKRGVNVLWLLVGYGKPCLLQPHETQHEVIACICTVTVTPDKTTGEVFSCQVDILQNRVHYVKSVPTCVWIQ